MKNNKKEIKSQKKINKKNQKDTIEVFSNLSFSCDCSTCPKKCK